MKLIRVKPFFPFEKLFSLNILLPQKLYVKMILPDG